MMRKTSAVMPVLAMALFGGTVLGQAPPAGRNFTWEEAGTSVGLLNNGQTVWRHVHNGGIGKPFMRVGLLDGTELTRPCPIPDGYAKADHTWHRALWWSFKAIDGVNYWEENQKGTEPVEVKETLRQDGSARIEMSIEYRLPDQPPVVHENRVISVDKPDATGSYLIDWQATFRPAGEKDVVFNRNSYGGFAIRMAAEFCGDTPGGPAAWTFIRSTEPDGPKSRTARWMAYHGTAQNGEPAAIAIFAHPDNPRYPALWQTRTQYPYLNPSFTCNEDYTLAAGKSLTLRYGVLIHQGTVDLEKIEAAWTGFAERE